jgi:hypothetical protein
MFETMRAKWEANRRHREEKAAETEAAKRRAAEAEARARQAQIERERRERMEREAARWAAKEAAWKASPQGAYVTRLEKVLDHLMEETARLMGIGVNAVNREGTLTAAQSLKRLISSAKAHRQEFMPDFSTYLTREAIVDVRNKFNQIIDKATEGAATLRRKAKFMKDGESWTPPPGNYATTPTGAIFTSDEFKTLLKAVHPDRISAASKEELTKAVSLLNTHKAALLGLNS